MLLNDIYNYEDKEIKEMIEKNNPNINAIIEFYVLITLCIEDVFIEDRLESYNKLEKTLNYYYKKFNIDLVIKIKNKKFLSDLLLEIKKEEKEIKEPICFFEEIPTFDEFL